jgi:maltose/moltooligosaccharide transporter
MSPLSPLKIVLYSAGWLGAGAIFAFANLAFPLFLSAYPVPNWVVGLLAQERSFVGGFVQPAVGWLSDHLPPNRLGRRRPFFLVGVPLTTAGLLVLSTHPPLAVVLAVMTVFAFFLAVASDPYQALLADIAPPEQRARIGGVMAAGQLLATVVVIVLSFLWWETHQALVFWLVALILVVSFATTFFGIQEPAATRVAEPALSAELAESRPRLEPVAWTPLTIFLVGTFFFWLGNGGIVPFVTRFGVDVLRVSEDVSFLLVLPAVIGAAMFAFPAGLLAERFGKRKVLGTGQLLFGVITAVGGLVVSNVPQALVLMTLVGFGNGVVLALTFPALTDLIPRDRAGTFTGIGNFVWSFAQPIGAVAAGALADQTGSLRGAFALGGACMFIACFFTFAVRHRSDTPLAARHLAATPEAI